MPYDAAGGNAILARNVHPNSTAARKLGAVPGKPLPARADLEQPTPAVVYETRERVRDLGDRMRGIERQLDELVGFAFRSAYGDVGAEAEAFLADEEYGLT